MKKIKTENLETVKNYLLSSLIPSRDAQELVRLLNEAEEIKEKDATMHPAGKN